MTTGSPTRFEVCVDSAVGARTAQDAGAHRVELCSALFEGGVTPSAGLVETALQAAPGIDVYVLIRPRGGDFIYDAYETRAMVRDIETAVGLGVHGVVIGALTDRGDVDAALLRQLTGAAAGLPVTFHRAFDMARDQFDALETLIALGVDRVLSSGAESTALEGAPRLAELVEAAAGRTVIMPGGGINARNAARILRITGAAELHFSASAGIDSPARHRNTRPAMGGSLRNDEFRRRVTDRAAIEAIRSAAAPGADRARP
ncbi:copper homeostasis protein [Streptomyces sp. DvalAA-14]|uniref:copper homeostasis protein CutC n=1 Tax=unclassified Streptomyces TaxID=2593676 RepID=UPI00081B9468|nr:MULTISPECIES: copper homeostasis protein CutC [unclassified Streptomyces]MYS24303.1 copper homeostasis protein CutC [Streptomyces sp. SID4948]SCE44792.1 copper homeostasis protein [Streptomyces sp. DvalAA-14]